MIDNRQEGVEFQASNIDKLFDAPEEETVPMALVREDDVDPDEELCSIAVSGFPKEASMDKLIDYFSNLAVLRREPVKKEDGSIHVTFQKAKDVPFAVEWFKNPARAVIDNRLVSVTAVKPAA